MTFIDEKHMSRMAAAVERTQAADKTGRISREYAATLYLLTSMEWVWPRIARYTDRHYIYCEGMLCERLSRGEEYIVGLAANLFNGGRCVDFTPIDLVSHLDDTMYSVVLEALTLRRRDINIEDLR